MFVGQDWAKGVFIVKRWRTLKNQKLRLLLHGLDQHLCHSQPCRAVDDDLALAGAGGGGGSRVAVTRGNVYRLRSLVCYYGFHYVTFIASERHKTWLLFDDKRISKVGEWPAVIAKVISSRYQPTILFYEQMAGQGRQSRTSSIVSGGEPPAASQLHPHSPTTSALSTQAQPARRLSAEGGVTASPPHPRTGSPSSSPGHRLSVSVHSMAAEHPRDYSGSTSNSGADASVVPATTSSSSYSSSSSSSSSFAAASSNRRASAAPSPVVSLPTSPSSPTATAPSVPGIASSLQSLRLGSSGSTAPLTSATPSQLASIAHGLRSPDLLRFNTMQGASSLPLQAGPEGLPALRQRSSSGGGGLLYHPFPSPTPHTAATMTTIPVRLISPQFAPRNVVFEVVLVLPLNLAADACAEHTSALLRQKGEGPFTPLFYQLCGIALDEEASPRMLLSIPPLGWHDPIRSCAYYDQLHLNQLRFDDPRGVLRPGDRLQAINGIPVRGAWELDSLIRTLVRARAGAAASPWVPSAVNMRQFIIHLRFHSAGTRALAGQAGEAWY